MLIKTATIVLAFAFFAALTMTKKSGGHLRRMGYPHNDHPVSRHRRWGLCTGMLMVVTVGFIEGFVVRRFGRQHTPLFWMHLVPSIACAVFFVLAAVFNGRWNENDPSLHRIFGTIAWYCGIVSLILGVADIAWLHP